MNQHTSKHDHRSIHEPAHTAAIAEEQPAVITPRAETMIVDCKDETSDMKPVPIPRTFRYTPVVGEAITFNAKDRDAAWVFAWDTSSGVERAGKLEELFLFGEHWLPRPSRVSTAEAELDAALRTLHRQLHDEADLTTEGADQLFGMWEDIVGALPFTHFDAVELGRVGMHMIGLAIAFDHPVLASSILRLVCEHRAGWVARGGVR